MRIKSLVLAAAVACLANLAHAQSAASLQLVFVLDGLRPDSITEAETPHLHRLRKEGVWFENTHAVFPTVTRVNSSSLGTGGLLASALVDIARARGMTEIARGSGLAREALYKALKPDAQPRFDTIARVCNSLGVKLVAQVARG